MPLNGVGRAHTKKPADPYGAAGSKTVCETIHNLSVLLPPHTVMPGITLIGKLIHAFLIIKKLRSLAFGYLINDTLRLIVK